MKKIIALLVLFALVSSCSENNPIDKPSEKNYPTNIKLPVEEIKTGDAVIIEGDFLEGEVYEIIFSDNIAGEIIEVTKDYLKVKVPENAVSGDVTLTYGGKTEIIGRIEIDIIIDGSTTLYGVMGTCKGQGSTANLIKINRETGNTTIVSNVNFYNKQSVVFNPDMLELYFVDFKNDIPRLMKFNLDSGEEKFVTIEYHNDFCHLSELFYNNDTHKLYGVMGTCKGKGSTANLVEINIENGSTTIVSDANLYKAQSLTFNSNTSELYFSDFTNDLPRLMKLNLDSGEEEFVTIEYHNDFCHLDDLFYNNDTHKLYGAMGTCEGKGSTANLVEINIETGSTTIISDANLYKAQSLTFNSNTSELYFSDFTNDLPRLMKLNLDSGEEKFVTIEYHNDFCHLDDLIIVRK